MQVKMKENIDFTSDDTDQEMTHFDENLAENGGGVAAGNGNKSVKKEKNSSNGGQKRKHDNNE